MNKTLETPPAQEGLPGTFPDMPMPEIPKPQDQPEFPDDQKLEKSNSTARIMVLQNINTGGLRILNKVVCFE